MRRPGVRFSCWPALFFVVCLSVALGFGVVMAEADKESESESAEAAREKAGDEKKGAAGDDKEALVFTDDDLLRMYGKPAPPPGGPKSAGEQNQPKVGAPANALDRLQQQKKAEAEKRQRVVDAEKELNAARVKLANLEKQLLAARNPYAARPELSDKEKEFRQNSAEGAHERHLRTKLLVEKARREVQNAEQKLAEVRAGK